MYFFAPPRTSRANTRGGIMCILRGVGSLVVARKFRRSAEMRYDILAADGRAGGCVLRASPRITPSRLVPSRAKGHCRISRVLAAFHRFPSPRARTSSRTCGPCWPAGTSLRPTLGRARARNEFNSTALRNWLRSHSSGKFLIVCPAAVGEFARSRRGDGRHSPPAG